MKLFGNWQTIEELGSGGQGTVFKALRIPPREVFEKLNELVAKKAERNGFGQDEIPAWYDALNLVTNHLEVGALKKLHPAGVGRVTPSSVDRMRREVGALKEVNHPNVIKLLEADVQDPEAMWFVSPYYSRGTLAENRGKFIGEFLGSLVAIEPLIEGVACIHDRNLIHRDIKPENIFFADNGKLTLGDLGLVIDLQEQERISGPYSNIGSRAWMPEWAKNKRQDDLKKNFDVFALGKVIWYMISGKRIFNLWYFDQSDNDLSELFPEFGREASIVNKLISGCVTEKWPDQEFEDAHDLLEAIRNTIDELNGDPSLPGSQVFCRYRNHNEPGICNGKYPILNDYRGYGFLIHMFEREEFEEFIAFDLAPRRWEELAKFEDHNLQTVRISKQIFNQITSSLRNERCRSFKRILVVPEDQLKRKQMKDAIKVISVQEDLWKQEFPGAVVETRVYELLEGMEGVVKDLEESKDFAVFKSDPPIALVEITQNHPNNIVYNPKMEIVDDKTKISGMVEVFDEYWDKSKPLSSIKQFVEK